MVSKWFVALAICAWASIAGADVKDGSVAYILRRRVADSRVDGLAFTPLKLKVSFNTQESDLRPTVEVHGTFTRPGWTLTGPDDVALKQDFKLPVFLNGRINQLPFVARGPNGEKQRERVFVYFPDAQAYHVVSAWNDLLVSVGVGGFGYFQNGFGTYNSATAVVAARYAYDSPYRFTVAGGVEMSALTLSSNYSGHSAQALQVNADAAYRVLKEPVTWANPQALLGVNYLTMFTNGSPFGISNLVAPEFGVRARHYFHITDALNAELRYVALDWHQPFRQNGLNFSFGWSRLLRNSHRLDFSVSLERYGYQPTGLTWIQISLGTLNVGYTL
jgi:hypothetical protein